MIISHKHRFIFIKTRKTAGTSIEIALSAHCGDADVLSPLNDKDEHLRQDFAGRAAQNYRLAASQWTRQEWLKAVKAKKPFGFYNHMPAVEIKQHVSPQIWNEYYKFTVERNPFDKVVSLFFWRGGFEKYPTLKEFILDGGLSKMDSYDMYSINKLVAVDKVFRFEEMGDMASELSSRFGIEPALDFSAVKAKGGIRKKQSYQDLYDEETKAMVQQAFAREIQLLGYHF